MNRFSYIFYTFIQFYVVLSVKGDGSSSSGSSKGPGPAVCKCFGGTDPLCYPSGMIDISTFPEECSSYVYDGMAIWPNGSITDPTWLVSNRTEGYFEMLLASGKDTYVYMLHVNQSQWAEAVSCGAQDGGVNALKEMETWKTFMEPYSNLKGVILMLLQVDDSSVEDPEYSKNLKVYLDVLKCTFPSFSVGVHLFSTPITSNLGTDKINWLDLTVIDSVVDFYVITPDATVNCTDEYKCVGLMPLDENSEIAKVTKYLNDVGIPKEKYIYEYIGQANSPENGDSECPVLYGYICTHPEESADYCSDTTSTYYEKGQYAAEKGGGFMFINIDEDDTAGCCQCGRSYPAFHDILDGFNGAPAPEPCPLFDRS